MATCTVTVTVFNPDETPWQAGMIVRYSLEKMGYSIDAHYPRQSIDAEVQSNGNATADLWVNEESINPTRWLFRMPNGESGYFSIPPGTATATLEYLRSLDIDIQPNNPTIGTLISGAIQSHNTDPTAHGNQLRRIAVSSDLLIRDRVLVDSTAVVDLLLPLNPGGGGEIAVNCLGVGFRITQRSGQQITFNADNTSLGEGGYLESLEPGGGITLSATGVDRWLVTNCIGNFEVI